MSRQGEKFTFWTLIKKHGVKIPAIQRDYVQGKKVADTDSIFEKRKNFLQAVYNALKNEKPLDLTFVYGKIHDLNCNNFFVPLDGQQRLTTLFLLHWYAFVKENHLSDISTLEKFSYETRATSRRFCKELISKAEELYNEKILNAESIQKNIEDKHWFLMEWFQDPTIQAMLHMLDCIHEKFFDIENLSERLTGKEIITFHFLDVENLGLEESVYMKINARGKPLTEFENFKAQLSEYVDKNFSAEFSRRFNNDMDGKYMDFFWQFQLREQNTKKNFLLMVDGVFMNFIHQIFCGQLALSKNKKNELSELINKKTNFLFQNYSSIADKNFFDEFVERLKNFLDALTNENKNLRCEITDDIFLNVDELLRKLIADSATREDKILFFAAAEYCHYYKKNFAQKNFSTWMQVIRRLVKNTQHDNIDDYIRSIEAVSELIPYAADILNYLRGNFKIPVRFYGLQVEEEKVKARLLTNGKDWQNLIHEMNNHKYLDGQAYGILSFAGILEQIDEITNWNEEVSKKYFTSLKSYWENFCKLFAKDGEGLNFAYETSLRQALLSFGDYTLESSGMKYFLVNNGRDTSWRTLLRNKEKRIYFKKILDEMNKSANFDKLIEKNLKNISVDDWRYFFVKYAELINFSLRRVFCQKNSYIVLPCGNNKTTAGYNREYYTYALQLELAKENISSEYQEDRGFYGESFLKNIGEKKLQVCYRNDDAGKYLFYVQDRNGDLIKSFEHFNDVKNFLIR